MLENIRHFEAPVGNVRYMLLLHNASKAALRFRW
ncbi:hypothetical protein DFR76_103544 [Nocardia pseudobrasiliensis]|uniref:Uncharacterized protein n=1 Tax=Nocardia pseudobrasiliensis TaxID=45979 RepID=A0A370I9T0_9NOCA|nr:hypothetical protein DFR76_103544 [Nocardia pseudobrasiliensis]